MSGPEPYRNALAGIAVAARSVSAMPKSNIQEKTARAAAMVNALRVMRMGSWRPTFPYNVE